MNIVDAIVWAALVIAGVTTVVNVILFVINVIVGIRADRFYRAYEREQAERDRRRWGHP